MNSVALKMYVGSFMLLFIHVFSLNAVVNFDIATTSPEQVKALKNQDPKEWTIVVYMAADNDLELFSRRNLAQLVSLGSNSRITLLVQLDTKIAGGKKITKRYYIEPNRLVITNQNQTGMDSGSPDTLIDCMRWASTYRAHHFMLILWNHGTGIIDIGKPRGLNPSLLFNFNPLSNLIELDRSIPFLDFATAPLIDPRGICFDDSTGNYLTNQKLEYALQVITQDILKKKIDIIGFDACLMSMIEIANIVRDYAHFMVSSQEVELGTGWDYQLAFAPLINKKMTPLELARTIVFSYETAYIKITPDYTQSAIDLSSIQELEFNVYEVAHLLTIMLTHQQDKSVRDTVRMCRHNQLCTHFDEPSYIDLHHFYINLLNNLQKMKVHHNSQTKNIQTRLKTLLQEGALLIKKSVQANVTGKNLSNATGISIYFPEHGIHGSYRRTKFAAGGEWLNFLSAILVA